ALAASKREDWLAAAIHWRAILKEAPNDEIALRGLGEALLQLDQLDEARVVAQRATDVSTQHPHLSYLLLGEVLDELHCYNDALSAFRKGNACEETVYGLNLLASLLKRLGEHSLAATSYRRALELQPDDEETLVNLANIIYDSQRDEALAMLQ